MLEVTGLAGLGQGEMPRIAKFRDDGPPAHVAVHESVSWPIAMGLRDLGVAAACAACRHASLYWRMPANGEGLQDDGDDV